MGNYLTVPFPPVPASGLRIDQMSPGQLWSAYIRYTGAGAVLAAGLITLARTIPTIVSSFRDSMKDFGAKARRGAAASRTERDMPMTRRARSARCCSRSSSRSRRGMPTQGNFLASILIVIFGFFFVTVSSRIVGLIGSSSNPISGMTIATLILTCTIFVALGWTGEWYAPIALCVGAVVCIAAANAGATSQDLKTGYIVGATPIYQQYRPDHRRHRVGADHRLHDALPAQRHDHRLRRAAGAAGDADEHDHQGPAQPEPAVGPGARRRVHLGHARAVRHPLAVVRRRLVPADRHHRADLRRRPGARLRREEDRTVEESEVGSGTLFSSGLIAGGSLAGILYAVLFGSGIVPEADGGDALAPLGAMLHDGTGGLIAGGLLFFALGFVLARAAQKKLE